MLPPLIRLPSHEDCEFVTVLFKEDLHFLYKKNCLHSTTAKCMFDIFQCGMEGLIRYENIYLNPNTISYEKKALKKV